MPRLDEGDKCPHFGADCCGRLRVARDGPCCCGAVHAPCSACEDSFLECDDCGWDSRGAPKIVDHQNNPLSAILADALNRAGILTA